MEKYEIIKYDATFTETGDIAFLIQAIANELAEANEKHEVRNRQLKEANRLKRLEFKHGVYILHTKDKLDEHNQKLKEAMLDELEDKA